MNGQEFSSIFLLNNNAGSISNVILEPWTDKLLLNKFDQVIIKVVNSRKNELTELEYNNDVLIIYGCVDALIYVYINEKLVDSASNSIKAI